MLRRFDPCGDTCKLSAMFECPQIARQSRAFRSKPKRLRSAPWRRSRPPSCSMSPLTEGIRQVSKSPGLQRLPDLINAGKVDTVIVAKLDRLTRSVKDLCGLLELFEKRKVALVSVAESLDTGSAAGRLVITIMAAVSQREREAIGERTRDALRPKRGKGGRVGNIEVWLPAGRRRRTRRARSGRAGGTGNRTTGSLRRS